LQDDVVYLHIIERCGTVRDEHASLTFRIRVCIKRSGDQLKVFSSLVSGFESASVWDRVWSGDSYADPGVRAARAQRRLTSFELMNGSIPTGSRVLDAGCGAGDSLAALSQAYGAGIELTGTDFSSRAVALASSRLANQAKVVYADVTNLPFPDAYFSHVLLFGIIEHVKDDKRALAEISRVSESGALVYISTSNVFSVLQAINFVRCNIIGYPYGYQKNWRKSAIESQLAKFLSIDRAEFEHADRDMPVVHYVDRVLARFIPQWGRYLHFTCTRK
jgi:ubiquinone/menaquinone biosynthesis C-methylase UbiE